MKSEKSTTEFYKRLKTQLNEDASWPSIYLYKFIIPSSLEKIAKIDGNDQSCYTLVA